MSLNNINNDDEDDNNNNDNNKRGACTRWWLSHLCPLLSFNRGLTEENSDEEFLQRLTGHTTKYILHFFWPLQSFIYAQQFFYTDFFKFYLIVI